MANEEGVVERRAVESSQAGTDSPGNAAGSKERAGDLQSEFSFIEFQQSRLVRQGDGHGARIGGRAVDFQSTFLSRRVRAA